MICVVARWKTGWWLAAVVALGLVSLVGVAAGADPGSGGFDPVVETERLLASVPAEQRTQTDAYCEGGYWLQLWGAVITVGVAWALLHFGLARRLRDWVERRSRFRYVQGVMFIAVYVLLVALLTLPWDVYTGFAREHQYGLSNLTLPAWLGEHAIEVIVDMVMTSLIGALLYLGIRRWRERWWIAASIATPVSLFLLIMIAPVFIAPLFNAFRPLAPGHVRESILSLARANGVPADNVYEFDASRQSKRISANVSGASHTIRISLNDNLLKRCTPAEIQAVMGHELGHYVLNHLLRHVIYLTLLTAVGFACSQAVFTFVVARRGAAWGIRGIDDFAGLPVVVAALTVFFLLASPVHNTIIRSAEVEADLFGLNAAREPDAFASVSLMLGEYRKLAPGPWEERLLFDHPSGRSRILMGMRWKAEHLPTPATGSTGPAVTE